jgi:hypothetical protein
MVMGTGVVMAGWYELAALLLYVVKIVSGDRNASQRWIFRQMPDYLMTMDVGDHPV